MKRLTKEREEEIRRWVEEGSAKGNEGELLEEIDALRSELATNAMFHKEAQQASYNILGQLQRAEHKLRAAGL